MSTPPIMSVTDELIAELEAESMHDDGTDVPVSAAELRALLSERAELRRDAGRYRWLRDNDQLDHLSQYAGLTYIFERLTGDALDAALDEFIARKK